MADMVDQEIDRLEQRTRALSEALLPDFADRAIAADLARFDSDATRDHVYIADKDARMRYEEGRRAAYDKALADEANALEQDYATLMAGFSEALIAFRRVPAEPVAAIDALRELAALQRYNGRTLAALVSTYISTPDYENPTLVRLIESDRDAFRLAADRETDTQAVQDLSRAVEARQLSRIPPAYRESHARAQRILGSVSLQQQLKHLKAGRGVAARPRAMAK